MSSTSGLTLALGSTALLAGLGLVARGMRAGSHAVDPAKRRADLARVIAKNSGVTENERATARRILEVMDEVEAADRNAGLAFLAESKSGKWRVTARLVHGIVAGKPGSYYVAEGTERLPDGRIDVWWMGTFDAASVGIAIANTITNHSPALVILVDTVDATRHVEEANYAGRYLTGKEKVWPRERVKLGSEEGSLAKHAYRDDGSGRFITKSQGQDREENAAKEQATRADREARERYIDQRDEHLDREWRELRLGHGLGHRRYGSSAVDVQKRRADLRRLAAPHSGATPNERAIAQRALAALPPQSKRRSTANTSSFADDVRWAEDQEDALAPSNDPLVEAYRYGKKAAYNSENKEKWERLGRAVLRRAAKDLGLERGTYTISFNPGGIAVAGDVILHHDRFYVNLSASGFSNDAGYARRVKSRDDYGSGWGPESANHEIPVSYEKMIDVLRRVWEPYRHDWEDYFGDHQH